MPAAERLEVLRRARLLALDVDGTLTDGSIVLTGPAEGAARPAEIQRFDVRDGIALRWLADAGLELAWISGRGTAVTAARGAELGVRHVLLRVARKSDELGRLQSQLGIDPSETIAMGDDLPDLRLRARAGFFAAPADARAEVRARADLVTTAAGGRGAVRELAEVILRARGAWDDLVESYAR
ncbi:MAG: HAD hydrolase family protein [Planctomycetes bacterium]|nr:HAD hydrolase family protein [Planctomycetota bacterium]